MLNLCEMQQCQCLRLLSLYVNNLGPVVCEMLKSALKTALLTLLILHHWRFLFLHWCDRVGYKLRGSPLIGVFIYTQSFKFLNLFIEGVHDHA